MGPHRLQGTPSQGAQGGAASPGLATWGESKVGSARTDLPVVPAQVGPDAGGAGNFRPGPTSMAILQKAMSMWVSVSDMVGRERGGG